MRGTGQRPQRHAFAPGVLKLVNLSDCHARLSARGERGLSSNLLRDYPDNETQ